MKFTSIAVACLLATSETNGKTQGPFEYEQSLIDALVKKEEEQYKLLGEQNAFYATLKDTYEPLKKKFEDSSLSQDCQKIASETYIKKMVSRSILLGDEPAEDAEAKDEGDGGDAKEEGDGGDTDTADADKAAEEEKLAAEKAAKEKEAQELKKKQEAEKAESLKASCADYAKYQDLVIKVEPIESEIDKAKKAIGRIVKELNVKNPILLPATLDTIKSRIANGEPLFLLPEVTETSSKDQFQDFLDKLKTDQTAWESILKTDTESVKSADAATKDSYSNLEKADNMAIEAIKSLKTFLDTKLINLKLEPSSVSLFEVDKSELTKQLTQYQHTFIKVSLAEATTLKELDKDNKDQVEKYQAQITKFQSAMDASKQNLEDANTTDKDTKPKDTDDNTTMYIAGGLGIVIAFGTCFLIWRCKQNKNTGTE